MSRLVASFSAVALAVLVQTVTASAIPSLSPRATDPRTEQEIDDSRRKTILVIHGVCGFLAFQILMPLAVVIASVGRSWGKIWFKLHHRIQLFFAFPLAASLSGRVVLTAELTPFDLEPGIHGWSRS
ncbi:hypothetical protein JCM11491_002024 [Sporobolomyces phaffii]